MSLYVITGGPGAGKTTLLAALRRAGFAGVEEVSRQLIREQVARGSGQVPWLDLAGFAELARARMVAQYQHAAARPPAGPTFFDRGLPDLLAYLAAAGQPVAAATHASVAAHPYAAPVFLAPPWPEIYVNDAERWQTFAEAEALYHALRRTYRALGYPTLDLPLASVSERVAFVRAVVGG